MNLRTILIVLGIIILLGIGGWAYWHFMMGPTQIPLAPQQGTGPGFRPLNGNGPSGSQGGGVILTPGSTSTPQTATTATPPKLRLLSTTPVGGYSASTTASTTAVVWVDRGRGNVYEAWSNSLDIATLSNTVVPKVFNAVWNKNLTAFVGSLYEDGDLTPTTVYAELVRQTGVASSTGTVTPYELRGKNITGSIIDYAISPDRSRILLVMNENGTGVGYLAAISGQNMTRLFSTPLTQITVDWPSDNIITVLTKPSANYAGFFYFVNAKTGVWTKMLGPTVGLDAIASHDGKYILYSETNVDGSLDTSVYSVAKATSTDAVIRTIAEKCAWGRVSLTTIYCGVPSSLASGTYPDAWYLGTVSNLDKIWRINAVSGEVKLLSSLIEQADRPVDTFRMDTDPKDRYLLFMNKNDLSLWSLDLSSFK